MSERIERKELTALCKRVKQDRGEELLGKATGLLKDHMKARRQVRKALEAGAATVLDLAKRAGLSTDETLWHVTALKKYGEVVEGEAEGSYPTYRLVEREEAKS